MTLILIGFLVVIILTAYFIKRSKKSDVVEEAFIEVEDTFVPPSNITEIEEKIIPIAETAEQIENRLKTMISLDKDKPFAKISAPEIFEVEEAAASVKQEITEVKPEIVKTKKTYKKRAPKENPSS